VIENDRQPALHAGQSARARQQAAPVRWGKAICLLACVAGAIAAMAYPQGWGL
jgi:hypothetical protein